LSLLNLTKNKAVLTPSLWYSFTVKKLFEPPNLINRQNYNNGPIKTSNKKENKKDDIVF
jgi:hypothetical protein